LLSLPLLSLSFPLSSLLFPSLLCRALTLSPLLSSLSLFHSFITSIQQQISQQVTQP
jgi:type II secretory pathway component PulC